MNAPILALGTSLLLLAGSAGYRLLWRRRFGGSLEGGTRRWIGRARGVARGATIARRATTGELRVIPFVLETDDGQRLRVDPVNPHLVLHGRCIREGDRLTLDGVSDRSPVSECGYRDSAVQPSIAALRLVRGALPRRTWLNHGIAVGALGTILCLGLTLGRTPAAPGIDCPPGARRLGNAPPAGHLQWCALVDPAALGGQDGINHGPWRAYWPGGRLRQAGQFAHGRAEGHWTTWREDGTIDTEADYRRGYVVARQVHRPQQAARSPAR